jgi:hypothetical protein
MQVRGDPTSRVAIQTEGLLMTGLAVVGLFFGVQSVLLHPHRAMGRGNLIGLMTIITVLYVHFGVVLVRGLCPGLSSKAQDKNNKQNHPSEHN